jgi:hypothetical protein
LTQQKSSSLQLVTFEDQHTALAMAVRVTMRHPAFARQNFGEWADILAGQARRGHQVFVINEKREIRGFFGYALASREHAQAWANGSRRLTNDECIAGDCVILNSWISMDKTVFEFMVHAFRQLGQDKQAVYFKRFYPNGTVRVSHIENNAFLAEHIARGQAKLHAASPN